MTPYTCPECGGQFPSVRTFHAHQCDRRRPYECDVCGQVFTYRHRQIQHSCQPPEGA